MSKSIKVSEGTYHDLLTLQRARETFNDVIRRLLTAYSILLAAVPIIEGKRRELEIKVKEMQGGEKTD